MLNVTPITLADHEVLLQLMQRIYPPAYQQLWKNKDCNWYIHSQYSLNNLTQELNVKTAAYYFIKYDNKTIGILRLVHDKAEASTKLHRLYLDQEYQGLGLGKQLMQVSENHAKAQQSTVIWLEAMDTQVQALHFYKKAGFKIIDSYPLHFELIREQFKGMHKMTKQL
ncbi:GNAT family N-acetyltransferase [Psychroserpens sp. NJDZ02]|uniref:GNAT family N-acetyltransferase n=1 Tax=Psychroserpens sp. NJDZ02 TaxID=2570561 RepID=UPI0010A7F1BE|nr:GNAT family N-acetyltransferase [Psychroserpens sp. NJDZ02]QCE43375.1 GNAT family N-acetyltransferase [Psychroserpens sp. NJDZ02]